MLLPMLPDSIALPNGVAPVLWRRSARARRISLRIEPRQGGVVITLPPRTSATAAKAALARHTDWVAERLSKLPRPVAIGDGAALPIDGRPHRIVHRPDMRGTAWLEGEEVHVAGDPAFLARRVGDWLRLRARRQLGQLATDKAASSGLAPRRVVVKDTSSRWGSCTAKGTLMFSWRLVMAPPSVQDYVVGHEVAHLRHMNHGADFWELTEALTPHRAFASAWLLEHGPGLMRIG